MVGTQSPIGAQRDRGRRSRDSDPVIDPARGRHADATPSRKGITSSRSHPRTLLRLLSRGGPCPRSACVLAHEPGAESSHSVTMTPNNAVNRTPGKTRRRCAVRLVAGAGYRKRLGLRAYSTREIHNVRRNLTADSERGSRRRKDCHVSFSRF